MTSPAYEWRPIDTAPRDGTPVMLSDGVQVLPAKLSRWGGESKSRWEVLGEDRDDFRPAYWHPFPQAPKADPSP